MAITLGHITFDRADPQSLAQFWSEALKRPVDDGASELFASLADRGSEVARLSI